MRFEAWRDSTGLLFASTASLAQQPRESGAEFLYAVGAQTWEEAMAIHHLRQGFDPYIPVGPASLCPLGCGNHYYPDGSAVCPACGSIV